MAEQKQRPEGENKGRRRMLITLVILLVTLSVILVKDRTFWFGADVTLDADEASSVSIPSSVAQAPSAHNPASTAGPVPNSLAPTPSTPKPVPTAKTTKEVPAKSSAEPAVAGAAVIAATRSELPPIDVEVVAGDTHRTVHPGNNSVKVEMPPNSGSQAAGSTVFKWSPATNAAERSRISLAQPETLLRTAESSYPSLARQMKVQGSVLLQAFVGADGGIRDLRVLSGNPILISAALEAARQWRFTPYLQNGQPVETQAKIMVNFTIKIL
jgi:TonB family protein